MDSEKGKHIEDLFYLCESFGGEKKKRTDIANVKIKAKIYKN